MFFYDNKNRIYQKELTFIRKKYISLKEINSIRHKRKSIKYIIKQILLLNVKELKAIFIITNIRHYKKRYNKKYYLSKLKDNQDLFDNILGYPLDLEQRKAIINDEQNLLILAGAGSGKTLTMVGKVLYLLNQGIKSNEILVISFTNASVKSFIDKVRKSNVNVDVFTFHKLGLKIIKNAGIKVRISEDNVLESIMCKYNINKQNKKVIESFIHLFKSKNLPFSMFDLYLKKTAKNKEKNQFIKTIKKIYFEYNDYLIKKQLIDFDDMINLAYEQVDNNSFVSKYKYILVDEYQDTSLIKFKLLKKILNISNSKLIVVGDDWQSIYRFTGCELNLFLDFKKNLEFSDIVSINNTYRNSQELIDIASNFITKNPCQLKKEIKSNKRLRTPINIVLYNDVNIALIYCIDKLIEQYNKPKIMIIGRNNNDILMLDGKKFKIINNVIFYKDIEIKYITAHKSKGLEEDNVIIINLENKITGFPSKILNHDILSLISNDREDFVFDEERRLFYVALTRTKNYVYLLAPIKAPSLFVEELIKYKSVNIIKV